MGKTKDGFRRVTVTLSDDDYERLVYWAGSHEMSINEYLRNAIDTAIKRENADYDLPTLEIARLRQIEHRIAALEETDRNLASILTSGFDSLLSMTRGDNYLLEGDNG